MRRFIRVNSRFINSYKWNESLKIRHKMINFYQEKSQQENSIWQSVSVDMIWTFCLEKWHWHLSPACVPHLKWNESIWLNLMIFDSINKHRTSSSVPPVASWTDCVHWNCHWPIRARHFGSICNDLRHLLRDCCFGVDVVFHENTARRSNLNQVNGHFNSINVH